jgi:chromosomal replication initiation ATPase DnaA
MTDPEKVNYIIDKGCEYFGISRDQVSAPVLGKSKIWYKKRFLVVPLYDNTALSQQEIATLLGLKNHSTILYHYRELKEDISGELYGSNKTRKIYEELLAYLKL